jgi:hypothetical protein
MERRSEEAWKKNTGSLRVREKMGTSTDSLTVAVRKGPGAGGRGQGAGCYRTATVRGREKIGTRHRLPHGRGSERAGGRQQEAGGGGRGQGAGGRRQAVTEPRP